MADDVNVSGSDAGTGSAISTPATPAAATPAASAAPAISGTPAGTTPSSTFTYSEDRSNWVPSHRLREAQEAGNRRAQEAFGARESQYQQEVQQLRTQLQALVGVQPPQNPEIDKVRQSFAQLYPGVASLEERAEQLQALIDQAEQLRTQNDHYWQSYGRQTMDRVFDEVSKVYGTPLNEETKGMLHNYFVGYVQATPERSDRYQHDPSIVQDFVKAFTSSFIEPARRNGGAAVASRVPTALPQDTPGAVPAGVTPAPKPKDLDERIASGWAHYNTIKK